MCQSYPYTFLHIMSSVCLSTRPHVCYTAGKEGDRPTHHTMIINVDASPPCSSGTLLSFNYLLIIAPSTKERILQRGRHCTIPSYLSLLSAQHSRSVWKYNGIYSQNCFSSLGFIMLPPPVTTNPQLNGNDLQKTNS